MSIADNLNNIKSNLPKEVCLIAVSKTKPISDIQEAYDAGQRFFGENKIQEMANKWENLPKDIHWHMIGSVQTNKVKYMAEFVDLIHAVDSLKLLKEINKQAKKYDRIIPCLLQLKIAEEETKMGLGKIELLELIQSESFKDLKNIEIHGLMGMASFVDDKAQVKAEFNRLATTFKDLKNSLFSANKNFKILSMGMSGDYPWAMECGSTMVRVGSAIFGTRNYTI